MTIVQNDYDMVLSFTDLSDDHPLELDAIATEGYSAAEHTEWVCSE